MGDYINNSWKLVSFEDIIEIFDSQRIPLSGIERKKRQGPYPYYGASGIIDHIDDYIFDGKYILIAEDGENLNSRKLPVAFFAEGKFWVNNHAHIVKAKTHFANDYFLLSWINNANISGYITGAAQPKLSQYNLKRIKLLLPPLPTQRKIAAILSAYDDLIENNQRRIKILEEMAQNLYREWFVKFRFPGHEQARFVDSEMGRIPEGWEVLPFAEIATYLNGYAFKPKDLGSIGKPIIKIKELKAGINNNTPRNPGIGIPKKYIINNGDVLFSWSASLDVYYWGEGEGLLNQHLFKVIPNNNISEIYIYHALKEAMPRFRSLSLGATMQHIKRSALDQVFNVLPDENLRTLVDSHLNPIHRQIITINTKVKNLRHTRDLLLPRLISGEVDVSELDINMPKENGL